ncbi:MAG: ABC transporter permease [Acidobacteriota bacterium]
MARIVDSREILWQMVASDLRRRYAGSLLGLAWTFIHPLVLVGIYTLVFSRIIGMRLGMGNNPYAFSIYLCAGLLPWLGVSDIIQRGTGIFLENAHLVKKIAFPRVLLHLQVLIGAAINTGLVMAIFLAVMVASGQDLTPAAILVWVLLVAVQLLFAAGLATIVSVLNVFFRDVLQVVGIALQIWFWLTPIVYVIDVLPAPAQSAMRFNILYLFTRIHQNLLLTGILPSAGAVAGVLVAAAASMLAGWGAYRLARHRIVDEL